MANSIKELRAKYKRPSCECGDDYCPVCRGDCKKPGTRTLYLEGPPGRKTPVRMCDACARSALEQEDLYSEKP